MKIHKERKDYVCSACGKGFSQKQALVRHERIHDGEKPFTCGLCQRTFTDSSILRRHMILIHKKDPKKWREDTISNVTRRTDFFISVVGENGEGGSSDNPVKGKEDQTLPNKPASNIIDDNANQENKSEEDSFSFVPAADKGSPGLSVLGQSLQLSPASKTLT
nr:hypothetical protein BaRGS_018001 [Batillaria attramentaria]